MLFINPNGQLCYTVILFGKSLFTMVGVEPQFDGYDINGNIINLEDWSWKFSDDEIFSHSV